MIPGAGFFWIFFCSFIHLYSKYLWGFDKVAGAVLCLWGGSDEQKRHRPPTQGSLTTTGKYVIF